jgi:predicted dehydrogenase
MARSRAPVRYAVVGLGHIAQASVLPAFRHASPACRVQALVSSDPVKLARLGKRYDVPVRGSYAEYERCLRDVDAVFICLPNTLHAEYTVRAAEAGVHVLCEKPLATTDADCARMITACRTADVKLMTAYRLHFEPLTLEMLRRVHAGEIGDPRYFTSAFSMHAKPGGIRTRRDLGGGTLFDLGVYCINAARMFFRAEPRSVLAVSTPGDSVGMPEIDEMTSALLRFDEGRTASFTTSFAAADVSEFHVVGTEGELRADPAYSHREALAYTLTTKRRTIRRKGRKRDQFAAELLYFAKCIREDRTPEPSGEEGAWDVRIVDALYESAARGETIALRQVEGASPGPTPAQAIAKPPVGKPHLVHVKRPHS